MVLYLVESEIQELGIEQIKESIEHISQLIAPDAGKVVEVQVGEDLKRLFIVVDADNQESAKNSIEHAGFPVHLLKEVRLIGQDLVTLSKRKAKANYLVEWNLPPGLTMELYLARKAEKTPLYEQIPSVQFERTYVCEDLSKCLCFYDSPNEVTVKQARDIVSAPIDRLTPIQNLY
ncbi:DUF4242 domain-containing protein [Synechocystis sp. LKSZ1]|uniref:DUF4242 domain-containing protein n=1 Tax=Synechocystis sp. LKSZ1 TaxID=3144951 RepID=UPI00336C27C4